MESDFCQMLYEEVGNTHNTWSFFMLWECTVFMRTTKIAYNIINYTISNRKPRNPI